MGKYQNISFHMSGLQKQLGPIQYRFDKVVVVEVSLCSANVLHGFFSKPVNKAGRIHLN